MQKAIAGLSRLTILAALGACGEAPPEPTPEPPVGSLWVSIITSGPDQDEAYLLTVADVSVDTVKPNGTVTLSTIPVGTRRVFLGDVSSNCAVAGENPRDAVVRANARTSLVFDVSCVGLGAIEVTTHTTGSDLDGDGYRVAVDGEELAAVAANATNTLTGIGTGGRAVTLAGVARNCAAEQDSVSVTVGPGAPTPVVFALNCRAAPILFARGGIHVMNSDGTEDRPLTDYPPGSAAVDIQPQWSPDGTRITFASNRGGNWDVYVMNADGSGVTNLTAHPANDQFPAWRPDGSAIAFQSDRSGQERIYRMRPDGSDVTPLTDGWDQSPAWSPDGSKIAFVRFVNNARWLYVTNVGTSEARPLSSPSWLVAGRPAWSPEGTEIAFSSDGAGQWFKVFVIAASGGSARQFTPDSSASFDPTWSPDGTKIAFATLREGPGPGTMYVMAADGTEQHRLGTAALQGRDPAWRW